MYRKDKNKNSGDSKGCVIMGINSYVVPKQLEDVYADAVKFCYPHEDLEVARKRYKTAVRNQSSHISAKELKVTQ